MYDKIHHKKKKKQPLTQKKKKNPHVESCQFTPEH